MKKTLYILLPVFLMILFGCTKDPEFSEENMHPRIFGSAFNSTTRVINEGETTTFNGLLFSPSPNVKSKITWKINDQLVSTDTAYTFEPEESGVYEIKLESTFEGKTSTRVSTVVVSPTTYTFSPLTKVIMPYISSTGSTKNIDWENITHIAYSGARVIPDGSIDVTQGNINQLADEVVARAHINGIPAILGVSGFLSPGNGWSVYNRNDFGSVIIDPVKRAILVDSLVKYVTARRFDGIDIMMNDVSQEDATIAPLSVKGITNLISELKAELPSDIIITATVAGNWLHWEYGDLSAASWVNIRAFENSLHTSPGAALGQESPLSLMIEGANSWKNKWPYSGDASKLVVGIPAYGVRYLKLDNAGNNLDWGSFNYMPYNEIIALDPSAAQNEFTNKIAQGVYYNGIPLVTQKAQYIQDNGFLGAYLWCGDYDALGTNSLSKILTDIIK